METHDDVNICFVTDIFIILDEGIVDLHVVHFVHAVELAAFRNAKGIETNTRAR